MSWDNDSSPLSSADFDKLIKYGSVEFGRISESLTGVGHNRYIETVRIPFFGGARNLAREFLSYPQTTLLNTGNELFIGFCVNPGIGFSNYRPGGKVNVARIGLSVLLIRKITERGWS
jgi:hypothetical protein